MQRSSRCLALMLPGTRGGFLGGTYKIPGERIQRQYPSAHLAREAQHPTRSAHPASALHLSLFVPAFIAPCFLLLAFLSPFMRQGRKATHAGSVQSCWISLLCNPWLEPLPLVGTPPYVHGTHLPGIACFSLLPVPPAQLGECHWLAWNLRCSSRG